MRVVLYVQEKPTTWGNPIPRAYEISIGAPPPESDCLATFVSLESC